MLLAWLTLRLDGVIVCFQAHGAKAIPNLILALSLFGMVLGELEGVAWGGCVPGTQWQWQ
jgi:hypothetical protein